MKERLVELVKSVPYGSETLGSETLGEYFNTSYIENCIVQHLLANGVIVPPCKFGDKVYVIPSKTNIKLNIINGFEHLNRIYEQTICEMKLYSNNKWIFITCEGMCSVHCDMYKKTWFFSREEAEAKLKKGGKE